MLTAGHNVEQVGLRAQVRAWLQRAPVRSVGRRPFDQTLLQKNNPHNSAHSREATFHFYLDSLPPKPLKENSITVGEIRVRGEDKRCLPERIKGPVTLHSVSVGDSYHVTVFISTLW